MATESLKAFLVTLDTGKVLLSVVPCWGEANERLLSAGQVRKAFEGQILEMTPYPDTGNLVEGVMEMANPLPGLDPDVARRLHARIASSEAAMGGLRDALSDMACDLIVTAAERIAPEAGSFDEATSAGFPEGEHASLAAEKALASMFRANPSAIDAMRGSKEWDVELPGYDADLAANALVRESMHLAEQVWTAKNHCDEIPAPG